jgi:hypothetical protein
MYFSYAIGFMRVFRSGLHQLIFGNGCSMFYSYLLILASLTPFLKGLLSRSIVKKVIYKAMIDKQIQTPSLNSIVVFSNDAIIE